MILSLTLEMQAVRFPEHIDDPFAILVLEAFQYFVRFALRHIFIFYSL